MTEHKFKIGGVWEEDWLKISADYVTEGENYKPCKHAHSKHKIKHTRYDGSTYNEPAYIIPFVVIAVNEGGYNSTGVCLDCIIEAKETLK